MSTSPVSHSVDADGLGWIIFNDPASRANVFNPATLAALHQAVTAVAAQAVKAVVVTSAKDRIFVAGADLRWLGRLEDAAAAERAARDGQAVMQAVADLRVPVVCAIHGACAGGGFELALACDWRVASDANFTVIGLPEVSLGLIPGWGGCVRLARLVGAAAAADHIIKAQLVPVAQAKEAGLVDEVVPTAELKKHARAAALRLVDGKPVRPAPPAAPEGHLAQLRTATAARMRGQPAPLAALAAITEGLGRSVAEALAIEARHFGAVGASPEARSLIRVFQLKEAGRKAGLDGWFPPAPAGRQPPEAPRFIGIVGAGVMGAGIAQWCAANNLGVMLSDADGQALKRGVEVIRRLFDEQVKRGRLDHAAAHKAMGGIGVTTDLRDFADCELVIEAVVEDLAVKQKLFAELDGIVAADCILASNTSALPVEEMMNGVKARPRGVGLHFFNPVARMPLVEVVLGPDTSRETAERAVALVRRLGKTPVVCRSAPGFYVTRVLFFYLNAACRLWEEGVTAAALDAAMRDWGWPMGPMRLIDEVGVDVTDFIFGELAHYFPDRFQPTTICRRMKEAGLKGRKNGAAAGFYDYAGPKETPNPALAPFAPAASRTLAAAEIQAQLNGVMVEETKRVLDEGVLKTADDADLALILGAGFPAWRGGLMYAAATG